MRTSSGWDTETVSPACSCQVHHDVTLQIAQRVFKTPPPTLQLKSSQLLSFDSGFAGAGEPNFDGLDSNPYRSVKQRQEWEVKALLEKIQPELISLDPSELGQVDNATLQQKHQDRVEALVGVCKALFGDLISVVDYSLEVDLSSLFFSPSIFLQGYDPLAKEKFVPKHKKKGRSSAGSVERRKKQVAHEDQRVSVEFCMTKKKN